MASYASEIITLDPADIMVAPRIGLFWPEKAELLGKMMARDGQHEPIKVVAMTEGSEHPYMLVAGQHRLSGARMNGLMVNAIVVDGDALDLLQIEASENMDRRDFGPIERSMFTRAMADIAERRFMAGHEGMTAQQIGQVKRWQEDRAKVQISDTKAAELEAAASSAIVAGLYGWQEELAENLGRSVRAIQRDLLIYRAVVSPLVDVTHPHPMQVVHTFARHPLGQSQKSLLEIAAIGEERDRMAVVDWILRHEGIETVQQAKVWAGLEKSTVKPKAEGQTKFLNNAESNLDRLTASTWKSWAPALVERIKPSALPTVRAALDKRIAELQAKGELTSENQGEDA